VTQFQEPRDALTKTEEAATTWSGTDLTTESGKELVQDVTEFRSSGEREGKSECEVRTFSESECPFVPEKASVRRTDGGEWKTSRSGPEGERGTVSSSGKMQRMISRELIDCPLCNARVGGGGEVDISDALRAHFVQAHGLKP
jgi:hypothetical protein